MKIDFFQNILLYFYNKHQILIINQEKKLNNFKLIIYANGHLNVITFFTYCVTVNLKVIRFVRFVFVLVHIDFTFKKIIQLI